MSKYKVQTDQLYEKGPKRPAQAIKGKQRQLKAAENGLI